MVHGDYCLVYPMGTFRDAGGRVALRDTGAGGSGSEGYIAQRSERSFSSIDALSTGVMSHSDIGRNHY
jgi:hypothetical protein